MSALKSQVSVLHFLLDSAATIYNSTFESGFFSLRLLPSFSRVTRGNLQLVVPGSSRTAFKGADTDTAGSETRSTAFITSALNSFKHPQKCSSVATSDLAFFACFFTPVQKSVSDARSGAELEVTDRTTSRVTSAALRKDGSNYAKLNLTAKRRN